MKEHYAKSVFSDLQIKVHEARRRIDRMREMTTYGAIPTESEVVDLYSVMMDMITELSDFYANQILNFQNIEEIELGDVSETPSNVVPFKKREE